MVFKFHIRTLSFSLQIIAFLFGESYYVTDGFHVSVKMYFNLPSKIGEAFLYFGAKQPTLDDYSDLLPEVRYICTLGFWYAYGSDDYRDFKYSFGTPYNTQYECNVRPLTGIKSFRFLGISDPTNASLSLYDGKNSTGNELIVMFRALTGIKFNAQSLFSTGNSEWKLFEGNHLNGNSYCFERPYAEYIHYSFASTIPPAWKLTRIGSVFRGCNITEIQEYKQIHNL